MLRDAGAVRRRLKARLLLPVLALPALALGALHGCGGAVHVPSGTPVTSRQPPGPAPNPPTLLPPQVAFDRYEVVTDSAERQTVLTGFLLGGPIAELAVVSVDEHDGRRLRIYAFAGSAWRPSLDIALGPEVRFVDIANIGGEDRLVTYESGRLSWLDPKRGTGELLVAVPSDFASPRHREVPHVDITRDVNGDGRDDLVVPDSAGFQVFVQAGDGTFANPVGIGPPTDMSRIRGADGYRYDPWSQSRVHAIDYDGDGRRDLAFWNGDHFAVHLQEADGRFRAVAETFTTEVGFDSDKLSSLATGDMTGRVLHALSDVNGDGVGDLAILALAGASSSSKESSYEVHLGTRTPDGRTEFAPSADIVFRSPGRIQLAVDRHDLDGDGQAELMFTTIDVASLSGGLFKRLKGAMGDDTWLHLEFYRAGRGVFGDAANARRPMALDGAPSHREPGWVPLDVVLRGGLHERRRTQDGYRRAFNRTLLIGDVTGDGRSDLLIETTPWALEAFAGVPGPELFARIPQTVAVELPNDGEYTWLSDLNRDGRQDIVIHHPFTLRDPHGGRLRPPGAERHRVTLLLSR